MPDHLDRIGQQVGDSRLLRRLGSGTFGEVYEGEQIYLKTHVAIKVLHTQLDRTEFQRFLEEARMIAALEHPHIVRVLSFSIQQHTPYLVMQLAQSSLKDRFALGQPQPVETILSYVRQAAEGLQHAHDQRMMHLDIKPANLLLTTQNQVLLADFGLAMVLQTQRTHQTLHGFAGTPGYAAPEQFQYKPCLASDQYALGMIVYQWLVGMLPFEGDWLAIGYQKLNQDPSPLRAKALNISSAVEDVVLRALAKAPSDRFGTVQDFAAALEQASQVEQSTLVELQSVQPPAPALQMPVPLPSVPLMHDVEGGLLQEERRRQAEEERVHNIEEQPSPLLTQTFPPTTSPQEAILPQSPVSLSSDGLPQSAIPSQSPAALLPPPTLGRSKGRLSPAAVVVLILLTLILLGGASFGIYGAATGKWPWNVWHAQTSGTSQNLYGVTRFGSQLVAVGDGGTILTSPDGRTWTAQTSGTSHPLYGVVGSGSQLVAVGDGGTILTSPDGRTWTAQNSGTSQWLDGVAWSGSQFVAVGHGIGNSGSVLTSPDGRAWTAQNSSTSQYYYLSDVVWSGSQFVVVGESGDILTSPDGRTWTAQNSGTS
jgi:serine/threonine protein kinase